MIEIPSIWNKLNISRNSNTSKGHLCILRIFSVDREKLEDHNEIYFMAFALKGKVLKIEKVISTCGRGHYVMQLSCYVMN